MGDESKKFSLRSTIRRTLFYGSRDDDGSSDNGDISGASDDSVDDPSVMLQDLEQEEEEERVQRESDDGDVSIHSDINVGASTSAGVPVGECSSAPRGRVRARVQGRGRQTPVMFEKKGRKREVRREEWKEKKAQKMRNLGKEYKAPRTQKVMPARKIGPPCPDGCFEKVREEARVFIFSKFWDMGDYDAQNAYIAQHVIPVPVKRKRKADSTRVNYEYKLKYYEETFYVCRKGYIGFGWPRS